MYTCPCSTSSGICRSKKVSSRGRISLLGIGERRGPPERVGAAFAARPPSGLTRRFARTCRVHDLAANDAGIVWPLEEKILQLFAPELLDHRPHFRGNELVLRLRREFRLGHFHREHALQTFANVVSSGLEFGLFFDFV